MRVGSNPTPARAQAASFDPNNPRDVQALARQYAPIRYMHPDEHYKAGDPLDFIHNARVREHKSFWPDSTPDGFDTGEIDPARLRGMTKDNLYLDLKDSDAARKGSTAGSPTLYQYDQKTKTMTYWFFYPYNGSPGPKGFDHEGDWERMTVQFDGKQKPTEVRYSSHKEFISRPWDQAPKEGGRPVVYVAKGSHANSPDTRPTTAIEVGGVPVVQDHYGRGERVDAARLPFRDVTAEPWYGTHIHWGQRGKLAAVGQEFTSGPTGPSPGKGPLK
ncbi:MAG TPA: Vps62-related protein [Myxococcales bacterium]|nr:Vps62-related protein [Myxococcales bacterium]